MGDVEAALAFVARRAGWRNLTEDQWAHHLSLELGWMTPSQARSFIQGARSAGLLVGDPPALAFDPAGVEVPRGFRPDPAARASAPDPFVQWLDRVAAQKGADRGAVLAEVAQRQERMGGMLTAWAAVLWIAADAGLDVRAAARTSG